MNYKARLIVYIPFLIVSVLLAPVLPLFAIGQPRLPKWLSWFMTPDNDFPGDKGWPDTYWYRVRWLFRNPAYGFAWGPLSYTPSASTTYTVTGDVTIKARKNGRSGWYKIVTNDGAFEWTKIQQLWILPVCYKIRFGWILSDAEIGKKALYLLSIRLMPFNK